MSRGPCLPREGVFIRTCDSVGDRPGLRSSSYPAVVPVLLPEGEKLRMGNQLSSRAGSTHTNPASHSANPTPLQEAKEMVSVWKGCNCRPQWLSGTQ